MFIRLQIGSDVFAKAIIATLILMANPAMSQQPLEEILVTAQKRVESLADVPISVAVLTGARIADAGIQRGEELAAYVPNFQINQDPIGDKINIRGVQSGNQAGFEQSVATFVDGIYRGRGTQSRWSYLDVARIEVLRGPQPALFGKNTVAGAVNITTNRPTHEFEAEFLTGYNFQREETEAQAIVSGPITGNLLGRGVVLSREMNEGWVSNTSYDEHNPDNEELFARVSLEWDAGGRTQAFFKYEGGNFDVTGQPWIIMKGGPISPFLALAGIPEGKGYETAMGNNGFPLLGLPGDNVIDFGSAGRYKGDSRETSLQIAHDLGNGSTITAVAGYSEYDYERYLDADFNPLPVVRFDDTEDFEQTSFELRLTSATGGALEYIAGLYYNSKELTADGLSYFNLGAIGPLLSGICAQLPGGIGSITLGEPVATAITVAGLPGSNSAVTNACGQAALIQLLVPAGVTGASRYALLEQESQTSALFTQLTWNIRPDFSATLGLRYTQEDKDASQSAWAAEYGARDTTPLADQSLANPQALAAFIVGEFTNHAFNADAPGMSRGENSFTWSLNTQWDPTDSMMVYASAATGFKAGGYNSFYMGLSSGAGANSMDVAFNEEEVLSFEIGAKMALLGGAAELNIAAFHMTYDDLQLAIFTGNTTFIVRNAAKATSRGVELDGRWQATSKLLLRGSLSRLDFSYDSFPNQGCVAEQFLEFRESQFQAALAAGSPVNAGIVSLVVNNQACASAGVNDMKGRTSAHSPDWAAVFGAQYDQPVGSYELNLALDISWSDDVYRQDDLDPNSLQESFAKVNLALIFGPQDGKWDISLLGRNLNDAEVVSYVNDMPLFDGARQAMMDAPRSVALRGRLRF